MIVMKEPRSGRLMEMAEFEQTKMRILAAAGWVVADTNGLSEDEVSQADATAKQVLELGEVEQEPAEVVGVLREDVSGLLPADFTPKKGKRSSMKQTPDEV